MNVKFKGFSADLVINAEFDGEYELPTIYQEDENIIPVDMIPFDKRNAFSNKEELFVHFYIDDNKFKQLLNKPNKYIEELREFKGVISPDFSLYRDMPYAEQISNTYINRVLGHYMQEQGLYVVPNIRWSDRRSFNYCFDGVEEEGTYCISTHGCIKRNVDKHYFMQGLEEFVKRLKPKCVFVHGAMPDDVFDPYKDLIEFIQYESHTAKVFSEVANGHRI